MTKDAVIDVIHKTIYGFFNVVEDDSEEPINEKDKLLLEVNKALCNAIKDMPDDEHKMGRWIMSSYGEHKCSECGRWAGDEEHLSTKEKEKKLTRFCPNCGAKMEGVEE